MEVEEKYIGVYCSFLCPLLRTQNIFDGVSFSCSGFKMALLRTETAIKRCKQCLDKEM